MPSIRVHGENFKSQMVPNARQSAARHSNTKQRQHLHNLRLSLVQCTELVSVCSGDSSDVSAERRKNMENDAFQRIR